VDYVRLPPFTGTATRAALEELDVPACPPLDGALVRTYLQGFVDGGYLPPPPDGRTTANGERTPE
jgi:hypothetical protein